MERIDIVISFLTICCISLSLALLPGPHDWFKSMMRKPFATFLIIISVVAVCLGSARGTKMLTADPVDTVRGLRIIVLSIMAAAALLATLFNRKRSRSSWSLCWMMAYAFLAIISSLYSKIPLLSLYKGFEVVAFIALGLFIGTILHTWRDIEDIVDIMLFVIWYLIISALIGAVIVPADAWQGGGGGGSMSFALGGVFPGLNPNTLTQLSGTLACCSICWFFRLSRFGHKAGVMAVLLLSLVCMILAHSRTSLLSFLIALGVIVVVFRKKWLAFLILVLGGVMSLFIALSDYLVSYVMRGQNVKSFASLSGRTHFWPLVTKWVAESPIIGHGFYSSHRALFGVSSVDNTYLEVLLGLGIIGLVVFCLAVLGVMSNLFRSRPVARSLKEASGDRFIWTELAVVFLFLLVRSFTGPSFQALHIDLTFFVLVTVCSSAAYRIGRQKQATQIEEMETEGKSAV